MTPDESTWHDQLAEMIRTACVWEATARKPGNVHPQAAFADVRFEDYLRSAEVAAPVLAQAERIGVGRTIHEAVSATIHAVGRNTNLGVVLLIAPLAAVPSSSSLKNGIETVLTGFTVEDAALCYEAIRMANPGGLGSANREDIQGHPTVTLREAMRLAADRDRIAAQYVNNFSDVLDRGLRLLRAFALEPGNPEFWEQAIVRLHLQLMAELPDTLIGRKCGIEAAAESARGAREVLDAGWPDSPAGRQQMQALDQWLRAEGNRRNPGTTADLVAAVLFAGLREGQITLPNIS